jgi:mannose-6-phosphate isomerase-like protein (cupin superfamily)
MSDEKWVKMSQENVETERSTCGFRRRLLTKDDGAPASITCLTTHDAKPHWHEYTHEYYYVVKGEGVIYIDDEEVPVTAGEVVWIKPPAKHRAVGDLESLIVGIPAFDTEDMYFEE